MPSAQATPCDAPGIITPPQLIVGTLNVAHGRKEARNQVFLEVEEVRQNLLDLSESLDRAGADMMALQEVDAPSWWSGDFDHVEFLAAHSSYPCFLHGVHASTRLYDFGTALLSPHPLQGGFVHSFRPSWPTTTKGMTVAALDWNPDNRLAEPLRVKFVSVHLDFSRHSVRRAQIDEMVRVLGKLEGPLVVMGDFNTDWKTDGSSLRVLADRLGLAAYAPHAEGLATYGDDGARLDWILVSPGLRFEHHAVYPEVVSDHYAVVAALTWNPER
ncbi:MAG: hypothetical protein HKP19_06680 [Xanthomonadales bacterium]|nr:hypothetical protein [Xanthomonadales bacterium]